MGQRDYPRLCKSHPFLLVSFRDLSCIHWHSDALNVTFVFVAFYVIEQGHELGWMQGAEVLVESLLFGLR